MESHGAHTLSYCKVTTDGSVRAILGEAENADLENVFRIGVRIEGRYFVQSSLGHGGMGHVFLAEDQRLNRLVAMKVVVPDRRTSDEELQAALAKEAQLGALLNHPGIATVFDFGVHAGRYYTIFEYIEGLTLREVIRRRRQLPLDEARSIIGVLSRALDFAHSKGVVHRDLKPENICVAKNGQLKILDLGIARDLHSDFETQAFCGTPAYASPEQAACQPTDGRTDQYALALMAYEMLSGQRVFRHPEAPQLLRMHREQQPPRLSELCPGIPLPIDAAVMRALEKDPRRRYATCQEFADALGCHHSMHDEPRAAIEVSESSRIGVYVCHVGDDSLPGVQLAGKLEEHGFTTWYYQRDALPGISLLTQTCEALRKSRAVLLLISRSSLDAHDFRREVQEAHQSQCPFLPVLVDMTGEEFASHQPDWRSMLGAAAIIELDRNCLDSTVTRLAAALGRLGIKAGPAQRPAVGTVPHAICGQIWATDANQIDIHDLKAIVFKNAIIEDFLTRRNKCFLSATKGLGKTLLLTYKRLLLTQSYVASDAEQSLCLVPQGRPFLDFMSEMKSLSHKYEKPLSELNNTKRIWIAALRISALSHHPTLIDTDEADELEPFPRRFQRWLAGSRIQPTVVFKELTSLPISDINRLIDRTENFLDQKLRMIHSGTLFFIDKVDQAVRRLSRDAWINIQAGLIEAAWDTMNANSHVRVFVTIRQEAFANYQSDIKSNLYGATTILRYTEQEMLALMDNLSRCYEGSAGFKDFVGLNVIKHQRRPLPEDSFQFARRHTFGRPRDLVAIASEISANRPSLNEKRYCDLVRGTGAKGLVPNVFDEMHVFLDCLRDKSTRLRFLTEIPHNILGREEAVAVSARFNGLDTSDLHHFGEESEQIFHPFRELYLTGLLGVAVADPETGTTHQKFKQPDDIVSEVGTVLPVSPVYFVHPALSGFISQFRTDGRYQVFQHVMVGENAPWEPYDEIFCNTERTLVTIPDGELRTAIHELLKQARGILKSAHPKNLRMVFETSATWRSLQQQLECSGHEDTLLWLEELMGTY